jgi:DNA end-binding protein Ku
MKSTVTRTIWRGSISFGLVTVPVRLYPATRRNDVRFHEIDAVTGRRLRHLRVRDRLEVPPPEEELATRLAAAAEEQLDEQPPPALAPAPRAAVVDEPRAAVPVPASVPAAEVQKGYEVAPDRYVVVSEAEIEQLRPERTRTIDVEQFVAEDAVPSLYFDTSYYAVPDADQVRPFQLLCDTMRATRQLAICWIVLRRRRHLAALRPDDGIMVLTTLFHADEVLPAPAGPVADAEPTAREREMARLLVTTLSGPFEPQRFRDEYRDRLLQLIDDRAGDAREAAPQLQAPAAATGVEELMELLKASVQQARERRAGEKPRKQRRGA